MDTNKNQNKDTRGKERSGKASFESQEREPRVILPRVLSVQEGVFLLPKTEPGTSEEKGTKIGLLLPKEEKGRRTRSSSEARSTDRSRSHSRESEKGKETDSSVMETEVEGADEWESYEETEEETGMRVSKRRKRGRPVTTGAYERKKEDLELKAKEEQVQTLMDVINPKVLPKLTAAYKRSKKRQEDYVREIRNAPTRDVAAQVMEHTDVIEKVAERSQNLQGPFVKQLREAAMMISAAVAEINRRTEIKNDDHRVEELEELRRQIQSLRKEHEETKREAEELKGKLNRLASVQVPPAPPLPTFPTFEDGEEEFPPLGTRRRKGGSKHISPSPPSSPLPPAEGRTLSPAPAKQIRGFEIFPYHEDGEAVAQSMEVDPPPSKSDDKAKYPPASVQANRGGERESKGGKKARVSAPPPPPPSAPKEGWTKEEREVERELTERINRLVAERGRLRASARGVADNAQPPANAPLRGGGGNPPARNPAGPRQAQAGGEKRKKERKTKSSPASASNKATVEKGAGARPSLATKNDQEGAWSKVVGRREKKKQGKENRAAALNQPSQQKGGKAPPPKGRQTAAPKRRRLPKTAAVVLTCPPGEYEAVMREARQKVDLADLGITSLKAKRAATGALAFELPGEEGSKKADTLAAKLREALAEREGVRVARPTKMAEIRLRDLDDSIDELDVATAVAQTGGCAADEVKVGDIRRAPNGLGTVWVRCPLAAANKVAGEGKIRVGWVSSRVELLETRPLQCFKCLEGGHVRATCPNAADRSDRCYRCGESGHLAQRCSAPLRCPVCTDLGKPANHRAGS